MNRAFKSTNEFDKEWANMGLDDDEQCRLEHALLDNPKTGSIIRGTGRLRKAAYFQTVS